LGKTGDRVGLRAAAMRRRTVLTLRACFGVRARIEDQTITSPQCWMKTYITEHGRWSARGMFSTLGAAR
jgi:hypothetical protein